VLLFFNSEDDAADIGDYLTLHGYQAGAPGDTSAPVWLATDEAFARDALGELEEASHVAALSVHVPTGADSLDRRHGATRRNTILVSPEEIPHLRRVSAIAGYGLEPFPESRNTKLEASLARFRDALCQVAEEGDLGPSLSVLKPLLGRFSALELASAAATLLMRGDSAPAPAGPAPAEGRSAAARSAPWVRLFVSIGERDGTRPGDIVGAITGEAQAQGEQVGKIEIRESFSLVEVEEAIAQQVIQGLNGKTLKGRSLRVDYDRPGPPRTGPQRGKSP
jgi:ATP-dependent RNA helicase DeaD